MSTLYIRNVPEPMAQALKLRADASGRSLNALVLDLIEREVGRDAARGDWLAGLLELRSSIALSTESADVAIASIRADRDGL